MFGVCECEGEYSLPTPTSAQKTAAVRIPKFMSAEEIAAIHEVSRVMEEEEGLNVVFKGGATDGDPNWRTHYLQVGLEFIHKLVAHSNHRSPNFCSMIDIFRYSRLDSQCNT